MGHAGAIISEQGTADEKLQRWRRRVSAPCALWRISARHSLRSRVGKRTHKLKARLERAFFAEGTRWLENSAWTHFVGLEQGFLMTAEATQTMGFQTEAKRLLHLMIHSLYSNREIFLRELISNASDAIDKHRFAVIGDASLGAGVGDYRVRVEADSEAKTITIDDNGIGMSRDEVVDNLGTIAKSGTAAFMEQLSGDQKADSQLIGQFGVGFYSSFIVADRVVVVTRKAGEETATQWESAGEDEFTISESSRDCAGTTITLHLKDDAEEFADSWRVRSVIKKYSDHISVPVMMPEPPAPPGDDEETLPMRQPNPSGRRSMRPRRCGHAVAQRSATRSIRRFTSISLMTSRMRELESQRGGGKLEYTSLLYLPQRAL